MYQCTCVDPEPNSIETHCRHCGEPVKSASQRELEMLIDKAAKMALAEGVEITDIANGAVHQWVLRNVSVKPQNVCFTVWLVAWRMADLKARAAGYQNDADRAFSVALQRLDAIARSE